MYLCYTCMLCIYIYISYIYIHIYSTSNICGLDTCVTYTHVYMCMYIYIYMRSIFGFTVSCRWEKFRQLISRRAPSRSKLLQPETATSNGVWKWWVNHHEMLKLRIEWWFHGDFMVVSWGLNGDWMGIEWGLNGDWMGYTEDLMGYFWGYTGIDIGHTHGRVWKWGILPEMAIGSIGKKDDQSRHGTWFPAAQGLENNLRHLQAGDWSCPCRDLCVLGLVALGCKHLLSAQDRAVVLGNHPCSPIVMWPLAAIWSAMLSCFFCSFEACSWFALISSCHSGKGRRPGKMSATSPLICFSRACGSYNTFRCVKWLRHHKKHLNIHGNSNI